MYSCWNYIISWLTHLILQVWHVVCTGRNCLRCLNYLDWIGQTYYAWSRKGVGLHQSTENNLLNMLRNKNQSYLWWLSICLKLLWSRLYFLRSQTTYINDSNVISKPVCVCKLKLRFEWLCSCFWFHGHNHSPKIICSDRYQAKQMVSLGKFNPAHKYYISMQKAGCAPSLVTMTWWTKVYDWHHNLRIKPWN